MPLPFISVIIPVKPGGRIGALDALAMVDYPKDSFEVIVSEGRQPSAQRNRAAEAAKGELLYFLDDDSMVTPGLFRSVAMRFLDPTVSVVGGPIITPDTDTFIQKGFGLTLSSMFGGSSIRARYKSLGMERQASENDLILANLCFRRDVFTGFGGFNENLYPNEENELMNRLQSEGHRLMYVPDAFVFRSQRENYKAFARQVFTYGRGRMDQNFEDPKGFRAMHAVPTLFLMYLVSLPVIHIPVYFLPLMLYLVLSAVFTLEACNVSKNSRYLPVMPVLFLTLHIGYGAGFLWGLYKGLAGGKSGPAVMVDGPGEITVRKVEL